MRHRGLDGGCAAVLQRMPDRSVPKGPIEKSDSHESKSKRKHSFVIPSTRGTSMLAEFEWLYEGAEVDLAMALGKIAADLWLKTLAGKLNLDGETAALAPRSPPVRAPNRK